MNEREVFILQEIERELCADAATQNDNLLAALEPDIVSEQISLAIAQHDELLAGHILTRCLRQYLRTKAEAKWERANRRSNVEYAAMN